MALIKDLPFSDSSTDTKLYYSMVLPWVSHLHISVIDIIIISKHLFRNPAHNSAHTILL